MPSTELLTPEDVALRLRVKPRTVQEWLRTGRLSGLKLGKLWRIRESDLELFLGCTATTEAMTLPSASPALTPEERAARIRAARGSMAHVPGSVDEFLRRKQEEIEWENRRWDTTGNEARETQETTSS